MKRIILLLLTLASQWSLAVDLKVDRPEFQFDHYFIKAEQSKGLSVLFFKDINEDCNHRNLRVQLHQIFKEDSQDTYMVLSQEMQTLKACPNFKMTKARISKNVLIKNNTEEASTKNYSVHLLVPRDLQIEVTELQ